MALSTRSTRSRGKKVQKKPKQFMPDPEKANNYVKALTHPIRIACLRDIKQFSNENRGEFRGLSPSGIHRFFVDQADLEGLEANPPQLGVISYHVRMLVDYGVIKLHRTEPRRGALEHFYVLDSEFEEYLNITRELLESLSN